MAVLNALQRTSWRGSRSRIGLDIGASGVRAVQLTRQAQPCGPSSSRGPDGYVVTNAACGDRSPSEPGAQATGQDPALALGVRTNGVRSLAQSTGRGTPSVGLARGAPSANESRIGSTCTSERSCCPRNRAASFRLGASRVVKEKDR